MERRGRGGEERGGDGRSAKAEYAEDEPARAAERRCLVERAERDQRANIVAEMLQVEVDEVAGREPPDFAVAIAARS